MISAAAIVISADDRKTETIDAYGNGHKHPIGPNIGVKVLIHEYIDRGRQTSPP
jgi:hypothetical protein